MELPKFWALDDRMTNDGFVCSYCGSSTSTEPLSAISTGNPPYVPFVCRKCNKSFTVYVEDICKRFEEKPMEENKEWICDFDKEWPLCPHCSSEQVNLKFTQFWKNKSGDFVLRNKHNPVGCFCMKCGKDFEISIEDCCKEFKRKTVSFDPNRTTIEEDMMNALIGD